MIDTNGFKNNTCFVLGADLCFLHSLNLKNKYYDLYKYSQYKLMYYSLLVF